MMMSRHKIATPPNTYTIVVKPLVGRSDVLDGLASIYMFGTNFISSMQTLVLTTFFPASEPASLRETFKYYSASDHVDFESLGKEINRNIFVYKKVGAKYVYKFRPIVDREYAESMKLDHGIVSGISQRVMDRLYPCTKVVSTSSDLLRSAEIKLEYSSGGSDCILIEDQDGLYRVLAYRGQLIFDKTLLEPDLRLLQSTEELNASFIPKVKYVPELEPSVSIVVINKISEYVADKLYNEQPNLGQMRGILKSDEFSDGLKKIFIDTYGDHSELMITFRAYVSDLTIVLAGRCRFAANLIRNHSDKGKIVAFFRGVLEAYNKKPDNLLSKVEKKFYVIKAQ